MLKLNLLLFLRNARRFPTTFGINLAGLTIGLTACLLVSLYIYDEFTYDRWHEHSAETYQLQLKLQMGEREIFLPVPPTATDYLKENFAVVQQTTRMVPIDKVVVRRGDDLFYESEFYFTEPSFFSVFDFRLQQGTVESAFATSNAIILSEEMALKHFSSTAVLGQPLYLDEDTFTVSGVLAPYPSNSTITPSFLANYTKYAQSNPQGDSWTNFGSYAYAIVQPGTPQATFDEMAAGLEKNYEGSPFKAGMAFLPLHQKYFANSLGSTGSIGGSMRYIYLFGGFGTLMLVLACLNYVVMATAQYNRRSREVGVRRVLGAQRRQVASYFMTEAFSLVVLAMLLAFGLASLLLPGLNSLLSKHMAFGQLPAWAIIGGPVVLCLFVGGLAGSYPAYFLTRFKLVSILAGKLRAGRSATWLRRVTMSLQLAITLFVVCATFMLLQQLRFIQQKDLGLQPDQVMMLQTSFSGGEDRIDDLMALTQRLRSQTAVEDASYGAAPGFYFSGNSHIPNEATGDSLELNAQYYYADAHYYNTLGLQLLAGRWFNPNSTDEASQYVVVNERFAAEAGAASPEALVGKEISALVPTGEANSYDNRPVRVLGVVKDFHSSSLKSKVSPGVLAVSENAYGRVMLRFKPEQLPQLLEETLPQEWAAIFPNLPLDYVFMDDHFANYYRRETRIGYLASGVSLASIVLACLGLFALTAFMAEQRTKEIGVRKVFGANVRQLVRLMSNEMLLLVLLAAAPAFVAAWWVMGAFLQDFAYRAQLGWWLFALSFLLVAIAAGGTVGSLILKAARRNPSDVLRYE